MIKMPTLLEGQNEAETRLKKQIHEKNSGGIEYPSGTNDRGYTKGGRGEQYSEHPRAHRKHTGREHHAMGDSVGGSDMNGMQHGTNDEEDHPAGNGGVNMGQRMNYRKGGCALPSQGGTDMKPMRKGGEKTKGIMSGPRHMAVKELKGMRERHSDGDMVGQSAYAKTNKMKQYQPKEREEHWGGNLVGMGGNPGVMPARVRPVRMGPQGGGLFGAGRFPEGGTMAPPHQPRRPNRQLPGANGTGIRQMPPAQPMPQQPQPMQPPEQPQAFARGGGINMHEEFNKRSMPPMSRHARGGMPKMPRGRGG